MTLHPIPLNFLIYEEKFLFFFISVGSNTGHVAPTTLAVRRSNNSARSVKSPASCHSYFESSDMRQGVPRHSVHPP